MTTVLNGADGIKAKVGAHLGYGGYVKVTQDRIDQFAEATGDRQWIHVDPVRAKSGPFGTTVAHGLLTLSMISDLSRGLFKFDGFKMGLNYGYDKIRFPSTVPVGSEIRAGVKVLSCEDMPNGAQTVMEFTVEAKGAEKPACVAQMIFRHFL